jgi:hypothetical protein
VTSVFASLAVGGNVTAGGLPPPQHQTSVTVSTWPPVAGVAVQPYIAVGGGGVNVDAQLSMNSATTGGNGQITGTFTSGDVTQQALLRMDYGGNSATINQDWPGTTPSLATYFAYDTPLSYTNSMPAAPQHTLYNFVAEEDSWQWDDTLKCYVPTVTALDTSSIQAPAGTAVIQASGPSDFESTFDPVTVTDNNNNGVYAAQLTVPFDIANIIDEVDARATDTSVYLGP